MKFKIVFEDDVPTQVRVFAGGAVYQAPSTHPSFTAILARLANSPDDESVTTLFDPQAALNEVFRQISPRVSVVNGVVLYDGDVLHNGVAKQILRFVDEGQMDRLSAVAAFTERVMRNPSENSRDQLFAWLDKFDFTITPEGKFVAYKAVYLDKNGVGVSSRPAPERDQVRVDGVLIVDEPVKNLPGSVVTMPRSLVADNVYDGCSTGLHCGTYAYAKQFLGWGSSGGHILEVHVDPVDVVSVPHDENTQKIRVCRYEVIQVLEKEYTTPILPTSAPVVDDEFVPYGNVPGWIDPVDEDDEDEAPVGNPFEVGQRVKTVKPVYNGGWEEIVVGSEGVVTEVTGLTTIRVQFLNPRYGNGEWLAIRFAPVEAEVEIEGDLGTQAEWEPQSTTAKTDTRQNYKKQQRYPKGHPKAGQFIPKDNPGLGAVDHTY